MIKASKKYPRKSKKKNDPVFNAVRMAEDGSNRRVKENGPLDRVGQARVLHAVTNLLTQRLAALEQRVTQRRDLTRECGYIEHPDISHFKRMWDEEGIARRVVSFYPEESWALDPTVYEIESLNRTTKFEKRWNEINEEMNITHYLERIDTLSGLGEFGVLLIGLDDEKSLSSPAEGLDDRGQPTRESDQVNRKIEYLRCFDQSLVKIVETEENDRNPRFNQPTMYELTVAEGKTIEVHWTRIHHVADNRESSEVLGTPRMRPVFRRLQDLQKVYGGAAEAQWRGGFPGITFKIDPQAEFGEEEQEAFEDAMFKYFEGFQRYVAGLGVEGKSLEVNIADPTPTITAAIMNIAITIGAPYRTFIGSEEAKLASSQEIRTLNKRLTRRQSKYLNPMHARPFIQRCIHLGVLPKPKQFNIFWPDLNAPSGHEKAQVAKLIMDAMALYAKNGLERLMPPLEFLTKVLWFTIEEAEAILEAVEMQKKKEPMFPVVKPSGNGKPNRSQQRIRGTAAEESLTTKDTDENEVSTVANN